MGLGILRVVKVRVVRRLIIANPELNLNSGFFFLCLKAFSRIIFPIPFIASNKQIAVQRNQTDFAC